MDFGWGCFHGLWVMILPMFGFYVTLSTVNRVVQASMRSKDDLQKVADLGLTG